jgi:hypothetical protein
MAIAVGRWYLYMRHVWRMPMADGTHARHPAKEATTTLQPTAHSDSDLQHYRLQTTDYRLRLTGYLCIAPRSPAATEEDRRGQSQRPVGSGPARARLCDYVMGAL